VSQDSLSRLIYASRRPVEPPRSLQDEVREILIASIKNNRTVSVTGLLISHEQWFLQVLEGPEESVTQTYDRIAADPRHYDTLVISRQAVKTRAFFRWTMCAQMMSDADQVIIDRLVGDSGFDPYAADPAQVFDLMTTIADLHGQLLTYQHAELMGEVLSAA
jgi:hypothetical protein